MQLNGLKINLLLTDLKEKEFCLKTGDLLEEAEGAINKLVLLRKADGVCRIEPLHATRTEFPQPFQLCEPVSQGGGE